MPVLTKIRMVGIQLDEGKKVIPDITWNIEGKDALFILENGGGKTSVVQLLTQTILPNAILTGRHLKDTLAKKTSGHIVTEWRLDGENPKYLCTGFSFMNAETGKDELKYYNYLFTYNDTKGLNIDTLPLVEENMVKKYSELKTFLHKVEFPLVRVFDVQKEYKGALKTYQILPEEWESIRKINGDEGGVAEFFAKAKTSSDLIKKLFIPTIESTIFHDEAQRNQIVTAYQKYKDNLFKIPEYRKDMADFEVIMEHADSVIDAVQQAKLSKEERDAYYQHLMRIYGTFLNLIKNTEEELSSLNLTLETLMTTKMELGWKEESFEVHEKELEKHLAEMELDKKTKEMNTVSEKLQRLKEHLNQLNALTLFNRYLHDQEHYNDYVRQIELAGQSHPELKKMVEQQSISLQYAFVSLLSSMQYNADEAFKQIEHIQSTIKSKKEERKRLETNKSGFIGTLATSKTDWIHYVKEKGQLQIKYGEHPLLKPVQAIEELKARTLYLHESIEKENRHIEKCNDSIKELYIQEKDLSLQAVTLEQEKESQELHLSQYKVRIEGFTVALARIGKMSFDLFEEEQEHLAWLPAEIEQIEKSKEQTSVKIAEIKDKLQLLEKNDYFVPHHTLVDMKEKLRRVGVPVSLGSEWLADQRLEEQEKGGILNKYPLLPYSFLIEENQVNSLLRALERFQGEIFEIPFLFQIKHRIIVGDTSSDVRLVDLKDGLLTYQPLDAKLFTSRAEIERLIRQLKNQLSVHQEKHKTFKNEEENLRDVLRTATSFYADYTQDSLINMDKALENCLLSLETNKKSLQLNQENHQKHKESIVVAQKSIETWNTEILAVSSQQSELQSFVNRFPNPDSIQQQIRKLSEEIEAHETKLGEVENEILEHEGLLQSADRIHQQRLREVETFEKEGTELGLDRDGIEDGDFTKEQYVDIKMTLLRAKEELEAKTQSLKSLESLRDVHKSNMKDAKMHIEQLKVSMNWLVQHQRILGRTEINESQNEVQQTNNTLNLLEEEVNTLKNELSNLKGIIQGKSEALMKQYGKLPFVYSENDSTEFSSIQYELKTAKTKIVETDKLIILSSSALQDYSTAVKQFNMLEEVKGIFNADAYPIFTESEWKLEGVTAENAALSINSKYRIAKYKDNEQKKLVNKSFEEYQLKLESTRNAKMVNLVRDIKLSVISAGKLYDYDYVIESFYKIFDALDAMKKQFQISLIELDKDLLQLVELSYQRSLSLYESIMEIEKHSKVDLYNKTIQMVNISWARVDEATAKIQLKSFVDNLLKDIQKMKADGKSEDEIDLFMSTSLSAVQLVDKLASIDKCKVEIFKPRKKTLLDAGVDFYPWEEAASWSGGEGYTSYMVMFMILITHIRKKSHSKENVWKTIVADNPFGKASSEHVVLPIMELGHKNKIQLFCLTAIREEEIRKHFSVVTSNRYYNVGGKEIMQTKHEKMEMGNLFYSLT